MIWNIIQFCSYLKPHSTKLGCPDCVRLIIIHLSTGRFFHLKLLFKYTNPPPPFIKLIRILTYATYEETESLVGSMT